MPKGDNPASHGPHPGAGRRSKLTPEIHKLIVAAIRAGSTWTDAAAAARVRYTTIKDWLLIGSGEGVDNHDPPDKAPYIALYEDVQQAEGEVAVEYAKLIKAGASEDWRAAAHWLKCRRPKDWSDTQRIDVTSGGNAITGTMTDDALQQRIEELEKRKAAEAVS
jgi:hypothetical protein